MKNAAYRELVLEIYDSVSDPYRWPGVLDRIAETVSGRGCIIFEWQGIGDERELTAPFFTTGYDEAILADYLQRNRAWEEQDQDIYECQSLSVDGIEVVTEEVLYADVADYLSRPHVRELREYGVRHRAGSLLDKDNPFRSRFSLQRSEGRGPLGAEERRTLSDLLPHLAKALDLGRPAAMPGIAATALAALVDRLDIGICLLDRAARVALTNAEFDRQCARFDAFKVERSGHLTLRSAAARRAFATLTGDALNHGKHGARPRKEAIGSTSSGEGDVLCIEIVPLHGSAELGTRPFDGSLVISRDTSRPLQVDLELLRRVYGLTATEAALIELIAEGLTNAEIARRRERSVETVNVQVKAILGKSRAANRTQFVRLLSNFRVSSEPCAPGEAAVHTQSW